MTGGSQSVTTTAWAFKSTSFFIQMVIVLRFRDCFLQSEMWFVYSLHRNYW
jgi:hypothetical protein